MLRREAGGWGGTRLAQVDERGRQSAAAAAPSVYKRGAIFMQPAPSAVLRD